MINMTDLINQPPKKDFGFLLKIIAVIGVLFFLASVLQSCGSVNIGQPAPTRLREIYTDPNCQPEENMLWGEVPVPIPTPKPTPVPKTPHRIPFHITYPA